MLSIVEILYVLLSASSDTFLYISLFIIGVISVYIIVQQSRPIGSIDLEASTSSLSAQRNQQLPSLPVLQQYHDELPEGDNHDSQLATSEVEEQSDHNEDVTFHLPSQSSETSAGIHNNTPLLHIHPPQVLINSLQDSLIETGSLFANDNHSSYNSSPIIPEPDHDSDGSSSSLDLD